MNCEVFNDDSIRLLWHKIIDNLDCLSYGDKCYLIGYIDCVVDSNFNLKISNKFNEILDSKLS